MQASKSLDRRILSPWRLALVGQVLFAVFIVMVISAILPPRLLNPAWHSTFIGSVLSFSVYPLIGLGLLHVAADLDPDDDRLIRRRQLFARLAAPASLAFLLLIPLQIFSQIQLIHNIQSSYNNQISTQERLVTDLDTLVGRATSPAAIFQGLGTLKAPPPPQEYRSLPLDALRERMRADLMVAREQLAQLRARAPRPNVWAASGLIVRNCLLSLAFLLSFAGLAQRRRGSLPLLQEWGLGLSRFIHRIQTRLHGVKRHSARRELASYMNQLINQHGDQHRQS